MHIANVSKVWALGAGELVEFTITRGKLRAADEGKTANSLMLGNLLNPQLPWEN